MTSKEIGGSIHYSSRRLRGAAEFRGHYRPTAEMRLREKGSIEHWLTERYCLYTTHDDQVLSRGDSPSAVAAAGRGSRVRNQHRRCRRRHLAARDRAAAALRPPAGSSDLAVTARRIESGGAYNFTF